MGARRSPPLAHLRLVERDEFASTAAEPLVVDDPWAGEDDPVPDPVTPAAAPSDPREPALALARAVVVGVLLSIPIWIVLVALGFVVVQAF